MKDKEFTEDDIRRILNGGFFVGDDGVLYFTKDDGIYTKDENGRDIKVPDPRVEEDTISPDQRVGMPIDDQNQQITPRKSQFDNRIEKLTDMKSDLPKKIVDSGLFYTQYARQNALMNITREEKAGYECDTIQINRYRDWDRGNSQLYSKFDVVCMQEMESRSLNRSVDGFERMQINREIVETHTKDLNAPIKQQSPGMIASVLNLFRGKK